MSETQPEPVAASAAADPGGPPAPTGTAGAPPYYCPGCGARYFAPGVCVNQHQPIELLHDPNVPLPPEPATPVAAAATPVTPAAQEAAAPTGEAAAAALPPEAQPVEAAPAPIDAHAEIAAIVGNLVSDVQTAVQAAHDSLNTLVARIGGQT